MSTGFTKLHSTIISSSIWNEDDDVRIVWVTMLAMADSEGIVRASVGGLAHQARKSKEATEHALNVLSSPDPDSSRKQHEGRRIADIEGGWQLVNHAFYRELGMSEETKAYWREKQREHRQKVAPKANCQGLSKTSQRPSASASGLHLPSASEGSGKKTKPTKLEPIEPKPGEFRAALEVALPALAAKLPKGGATTSIPDSLNVPVFQTAWSEFEEHRKQLRKRLTPLAAKKQLAALAEMGVERAVIAINHSIKCGWQSIHEPKGEQTRDNHTGRITVASDKYARATG